VGDRADVVNVEVGVEVGEAVAARQTSGCRRWRKSCCDRGMRARPARCSRRGLCHPSR